MADNGDLLTRGAEGLDRRAYTIFDFAEQFGPVFLAGKMLRLADFP